MAAGTFVIAAVSLDCADHLELAEFYARMLDGTLLWSTPTSAGIRCGSYVLAAQRVEGYAPPQWPGSAVMHLDLNGNADAGASGVADARADAGADDDIETLVQAAVAAGARVAEHQPDPRWRVLLDPAGHPFCITPYAPPQAR